MTERSLTAQKAPPGKKRQNKREQKQAQHIMRLVCFLWVYLFQAAKPTPEATIRRFYQIIFEVIFHFRPTDMSLGPGVNQPHTWLHRPYIPNRNHSSALVLHFISWHVTLPCLYVACRCLPILLE